MMPKFYYYIVAKKLAENPYTAAPAVNTENLSLHFNEETMEELIIASRDGNILRERIDSESETFCNAAAEMAAIKNIYVLT